MLPWIVDATLHAKESGPPLHIWSKTAIDALPEIGLNITIGVISIKSDKEGMNLHNKIFISVINPQLDNKVKVVSDSNNNLLNK